jgi:hypothetical protein
MESLGTGYKLIDFDKNTAASGWVITLAINTG